MNSRIFIAATFPIFSLVGQHFLSIFAYGSLPNNVIERLQVEAERMENERLSINDGHKKSLLRDKQQQILFAKWDDALHESQTGPFWLKDQRIAQIVVNSILYHDGEWFDVLAYCIMPNHAHLVLTPYKSSDTADYSLTKIMHNVKRNSANHANKVLGRTGAFWQHESYDHFARDNAELQRIIKYVLYNPVKAGLVKEQTDWEWSYCKYAM